MIGESEARLTARIDDWGERVTKVVEDHETRLAAEEEFTIGAKASASTAKLFFSFGRWVLATVIALSALAATALAMVPR